MEFPTVLENGHPRVQVEILVCYLNEPDKCIIHEVILKNIELDLRGQCLLSASSPVSHDLDNLPIADVMFSLKALGMYAYTTDLQKIKATLRDVLLENFYAMLTGTNLAGTEFPEPFDICFSGTFPAIEKRMTFLDISIWIPLPPIGLTLGFGVGGGVGLSLAAEVCVISMKVTGWARPYAGVEAYASAGVSLGPLRAGVRLAARILETTLPAFVTVTFSNFPLKVCLGVDWVTVPLSIRLEGFPLVSILFVTEVGFVQLRLCLWKCWTKTLLSATLWKWSSPGNLTIRYILIINNSHDRRNNSNM